VSVIFHFNRPTVCLRSRLKGLSCVSCDVETELVVIGNEKKREREIQA